MTATVKGPGRAWRSWPTREQVLETYGLSAQQLGQLQRHNKLRGFPCRDKTIRFDPRQLEVVFRLEPDDDDDDDDVSSVNELPQDPMLLALLESNRVLLEAQKEAREQAKEAREQTKELLDLFFKQPMNQVLVALKEHSQQQSDENRKLYAGWIEALTAREQLISQQHERTMIETVVQGDNERAAGRQKMLEQYAPMVLMHLVQNSESAQLASMLRDLPPEVADALKDALTPEQVAMLSKLRGAPKNGGIPHPTPESAPS